MLWRIKHFTITSRSKLLLPAGELFCFVFAIVSSIGFNNFVQFILPLITSKACLL